jgi:hypothetical protein
MEFTIKELNELIYSLGITALNGKTLDKELNQSLMEKLHCELGYQLSWEEHDEWEIEENVDNFQSDSHFVSNEEADEDYRISLMQDARRYEDSHKKTGATQAILDYVESTGPSTYTELNDFYKFVTGGSNSFSHILKALRIPYKNRYTRRYLVKGVDGKYIVKLADPSNWVVIHHYNDDFKTFNEAPYGND